MVVLWNPSLYLPERNKGVSGREHSWGNTARQGELLPALFLHRCHPAVQDASWAWPNY